MSRFSLKKHRDVVLGIGLASVVAVNLFVAARDGNISYAVAIPVSITAAVACMISALLLAGNARNDARRIDESRERAREAEQEYERALREHRGDVVYHVSGDLHIGALPPPEDAVQRDGEAGTTTGVCVPDGASPPTFPELWNVTHRKLDYYHDIATGQATRAFRNAQIAMGVGFVFLLAFVVIALQASTTAGSVVAGGLGAVGAAMAAFISRTFVRSHEVTSGHLQSYFEQPVELSRYLAAERLISDAGLSEERRAEVLTVVVEAMVTDNSQNNGDGNSRAT